MEKVLILGATGLLGRHLSEQLKSNHEVVGHGRNQKDAEVHFDLEDRLTMSRHLDAVAPTVIVNLVALTNVDQCQTEPQRAYQVNVRTVENLVSWREERKSTAHIIQISTDQVYDGPGLKKEEEVTLLNVYAWSKYCAEQVVARAGGTSLRTNFFGRSRTPGRKSFSDWLLDAFQNREPLRLFSDIYFSPLSMTSLCRNIERVIQSPKPGCFNLGSCRGFSKAEFAIELAKAFGIPIDNYTVVASDTVSLAAPRPKDMRMDSSAFEKAFDCFLPSLYEEIKALRDEYEIPFSNHHRQQGHQPRKSDVLHR